MSFTGILFAMGLANEFASIFKSFVDFVVSRTITPPE
jgi:hypothetical protein